MKQTTYGIQTLLQLMVTLLLLHCNAFSQTDIKDKFSGLPSQYTISVTIGGNFIANGTFMASPTERVDQFVTRMFNEMIRLQSGNSNIGVDLAAVIKRYPRRGIKVKRNTGEELTVDLEKFRLTGNYTYNPYLRNEDVIIFPKRDTYDVIAVNGAVNNPTEFEYIDGDKVEDALLFAQGLNPMFRDSVRMEIVRLTYDGKLDTMLTLPIDRSFPLKRGDRIRFIDEEPRRRNYRAYIEGEVFQPGWVYLPVDGLPVRQVITLAGGLRKEADLSRAEIIRGGGVFQSVYFNPDLERLMMQRMSVLAEEDSLTFFIDNILRTQRASVATSMKNFEIEQATSMEVVVRDGDYIFIPRKIDYVYVFGQVNNFGFVPFVSGKDYTYYIEQAGGVGETAKEDIYVIKNRTRAWHLATEKNVSIEPGDFVWVPKKPVRDFDYYLQRIGFIGSIVTGIVTTILLAVQITKK